MTSRVIFGVFFGLLLILFTCAFFAGITMLCEKIPFQQCVICLVCGYFGTVLMAYLLTQVSLKDDYQ